MTMIIFSAVVGYLLGSISFSYIIAKKVKKVDIRQHGSGNAGATNTLRVLGTGPAILVLLCDALKGIIAVLIGLYLAGEGLAPALAGLMAIVGHNWPVFLKFKGGKGVATTIGVLATLVFLPALYAGIIAIVSIVITRFVSLGSLLFLIGTTLLTIVFRDYFIYPIEYVYLLLIVTALSFWRHRSNISRLLSGTENKVGKKVK
ncbi:acyl-phosphate glycerol 3-phosphate acyltransferase [Anaerobacillus arseniciselenatis]|uniref:Glycerol-3-phosphate acyltransferase n=1 Tax=Anaerobacillus arseniciselenatis TaxID=85682 RepID=A0A1S2LU41_9BACI|nr:glycerol-3-phosphate 1-O-acyltransferase PlsY [Anaerobacillus arseniciselenatis]OIJ15866.1 acyl-phosphate glycerol 3-phosphate acyltransferase [Anaerobacillus arseniciselenatis]